MEDITIIKLIKLFARINTQFTNLESDLNELPDFQDVKRYCEFRERNGKSLISLGIDSELIQPYKGGIFSSDPLFSIGISFEIWVTLNVSVKDAFSLPNQTGIPFLHFDYVFLKNKKIIVEIFLFLREKKLMSKKNLRLVL